MFSEIAGIGAIVLILGTLFVLFENAKFNQACDKGDLEYVKTKLSKFNCLSVNNISMEKAIKSGNIELVEYLIPYFDLKESTIFLDIACKYNQHFIINLLIEKGATVGHFYYINSYYYIQKYLSSIFNKDLFILYINNCPYITHSVLLNIVKNKEFDLIKLIIEKDKGQLVTCLILASTTGEIDLFTYLVENYTISEVDFQSGLDVAIENHQVDIVKLFVEKEIKINKEPNSNISKLIEIAKLLAK